MRQQNSIFNLLSFAAAAFAILFTLKYFVGNHSLINSGLSDFACFYATACIVSDGRGEDIYNYQAQQEKQTELFRPGSDIPALPFLYLAYIAPVWIPFTMFSVFKAQFLWGCICIFLIWLSARLMSLEFTELTKRQNLYFLSLVFAPTIFLIIQGQTSAILLLIFVSAFFIFSRNPFLAGMIFAFGLFKFTTVLPVVGLLLMLGQWRFVLGFICASPLFISASLWITGLLGASKYFDQYRSSPLGSTSQTSISLRGLIYTMGLPDGLNIALVIGLSIAVIAITIKRAQSLPAQNQFVLCTLTALTIAPHILFHDYLLLLLPIFYFANDAKNRKVLYIILLSPIAATLSVLSPLILAKLTILIAAIPYYLACISRGMKPNGRFCDSLGISSRQL